MRECPACRTANSDHAKFCAECATPLTVPGAAREVRKVVSIVFADITGSTELGERLDPESVRHLLTRYFIVMRQVLERHGGTVEKFIGDAVMAVFGIPLLHEDDALRAVRAAAEMREQVAALNEQIAAGAAVTLRIGINTGEVVAGDPSVGQTLVTGDAVNTAARLEQAAAPGDILIGSATFGLVRDAVVADAVDPLVAKGKAQQLAAYRLLSVIAGAAGHARRLDTPIVGRQTELGLLGAGLERCVAEGAGYLYTVIGPAGVGKSRLLHEFLAGVGETATIIRGRCLPYGEGITYWPLRELIHDAAGISDGDAQGAALAKLGRLVGPDRDAHIVANRLATAVGLTAETVPQDEIFWAVRRLLHHLARHQPLVVVIEDIHWAHATFLDLLEYLTDLLRDVPLLLLCPARPELLDVRPGWGGGKPNANSLLLEPLSADGSGQLLDALPGGAALPTSLRQRILDAADGNPLYVEEMVGMLVEEGVLQPIGDGWAATDDVGRVRVPDTVAALLAARIDGLPDDERSLAVRAAVAGRVFETGAVHALVPVEGRPQVARTLLSLVRKELLRPERAELTVGDAYKFRHVLLRDAAYQALPKAERGELHERFAAWLQAVAAARLNEFAEIVGYHLEQAHRYHAELQVEDQSVPSLASRAARLLGVSGSLAHARGDMRTTVNLLGRAAALWPAGAPERLEILPDLADGLAETGEVEKGLRILVEGLDLANDLGDARLRAHLVLAHRSLSDEEPWADLAERDAQQVLEVFQAAGDHAGLAAAWRMLGFAAWERAKIGPAVTAWTRAADHARTAGDAANEAHDRVWLLTAQFFGPYPAADGLKRAQETLALVEHVPAAKAEVLWSIADFHTMLGQFSDARRALAASRDIERELGRDATWSHFGTQSAEFIEKLEGRKEERVRVLREGADAFERATRRVNPLLNGLLAHALAEAGQDDEAEAVAHMVEASAAGDQPFVSPSWMAALAQVRARQGATEEAESLARRGVATMRDSEFMWEYANALMTLAEVLRVAGKPREAIAAAREALDLYEAKGIKPLVSRARGLLETLDAESDLGAG